MAEPTVQVPVSLIERAEQFDHRGGLGSEVHAWLSELLTLLSQPTPSAAPVLTTEMDQEVRIITNADNSMAWVYFDHGISLNRSEMLAFANALLEAAGIPGAPPLDQDPVMRLLEEVYLSEYGHESPCVENMAAGTTFTAVRWVDGKRMMFERIERTPAGAILRSGSVHYGITVIDPSTIRDVMVPKEQP